MRTLIIVLSNALTIAATLPYLVEIVKGKTKPRLASWFTWSAIVAIGAAASFAQHQIPAAIYSLCCSLECAAVVVLGLKHGDRQLEKLDIVSLAGVTVGLVSLMALKSPTLTVFITILTDSVGAIPTIKHSWVRPWEETWSAYVLYALGSGTTLLVANFHVFTAIAYPLYLLIQEVLLVGIILLSPHRKQAMEEASAESISEPRNTPLPTSVLIASATPVVDSNLPASAPGSPSKLRCASPTQVPALTWATAAGATSYNIYREGIIVATTQAATYVDTTASENNYRYYVTAVNEAGESSQSNTVSVMVDQTPPSITYDIQPRPAENSWNKQPVTITFRAEDAKVGIASCSPPKTLDRDGINQTVIGSAMNYAGDSSSVTAVVSIDQTPPTLGKPSWSANPVTRNADSTLTIPVVDHTSGVTQGEYIGSVEPGPGKGAPMALSSSKLTVTFKASVPSGRYPIRIRARDAAGNWSDLVDAVLTVE